MGLKQSARSLIDRAPAPVRRAAYAGYSWMLRNRFRGRRAAATIGFERAMAASGRYHRAEDLWCLSEPRLTPDEVKAENLRWLLALLESAGARYFYVRTAGAEQYSVGMSASHREALYRALRDRGASEPVYLQVTSAGGATSPAPFPAVEIPYHHMMPTATVLRVALPRHAAGLTYGVHAGVTVELWAERGGRLHAPRANTVGSDFAADLLDHPALATVGDVRIPTIAPFLLPGMDEVQFPIDLVYTWVDGGDPEWRRRMLAARDGGVELHPESTDAARFENREELRYSLRSAELYAPWFNHIYLVTDHQTPDWLDTTAPGLTVVDHTEIFEDPAKLPVFNSNAIISQLHRIPGLSEHYIYVNDDVFFGRPCTPAQFFTSGGVAKVFASRNLRPYDEPSSDVEPHFNITTNIRAMIERDFGCAIANAIKHTPHAQIRSVHEEMAQRYAAEYARTSGAKFRHHDDFAADQLFHYYAQLTGRAVPGSIQYQYVNVRDIAQRDRLENLLRLRDRDVFCLNDAPVIAEPMPGHQVIDFLECYFPYPSRFER